MGPQPLSMPDDKRGREKQARDAQNRQRQRDIVEARSRAEEPEPPIQADELDEIEQSLETVSFPATGRELVETVGDRPIESIDRPLTIADLLPKSEREAFESSADVRKRLERPMVAVAMKRILEVSEQLPGDKLHGTQWDAYERTFHELHDIDSVDEDEGIQVISDWIVDRIEDKEKLPGSRDVRREAAKYCRKNGYEIRNDEWLGV